MAPMANDIKKNRYELLPQVLHQQLIKPASHQNRLFLDILLFIEGVWQSFVSFYEFEVKIYLIFAKTQVWGKMKKLLFDC